MAAVPDPDNILRSLRMDLKIRIGGAWAGVYILVVVRFLGPRTKTKKTPKPLASFWAPAGVNLWAPTQFFAFGGPNIKKDLLHLLHPQIWYHYDVYIS